MGYPESHYLAEERGHTPRSQSWAPGRVGGNSETIHWLPRSGGGA